MEVEVWSPGGMVWISRGIDLAKQLFFPVFYLHYLFFKYGEWFQDFFTGINKFPDLTSPSLEKSKLGFPKEFSYLFKGPILGILQLLQGGWFFIV